MDLVLVRGEAGVLAEDMTHRGVTHAEGFCGFVPIDLFGEVVGDRDFQQPHGQVVLRGFCS